MVTESGMTVSGNTLLELMKHIGNDRHLTMKQPMETVLTRSEWKLRWEASTRGAKVECWSGRAGAWGRKEWGKSVGSAGSTCPLALCENRRAARGRESAFIGHLPWLGDRPEPFWSTLPCAGFCFQ